MKNLLLLLAGAVCFSLTSCSNDDDDAISNPEPQVTRMQMITAQDWQIASMMETREGRTVDLVAALPETSRDDVFKFSEVNGEVGEAIREEGATREIGNPDIVEGSTFELRNQERELQVAFDRLPINDQIVEMTRDRIVLRNFDGEREVLTTFQAL